jgi:hypothetical protein
MLDATLILQDAEELLDAHFTDWQTTIQRQQQRSNTTPRPATTPLPAAHNAPNALNELVANVFVLLLLSVVNHSLSKQPLR